ncbi:MAG: DMT family transporter [Elusimicrobium sp.]|jgi:drug/metabolite transporter (DMT)-like permease|nr:DMT family transporter [Elusimicrobium sp.]
MSPLVALWSNWLFTGMWPIAGGFGTKFLAPSLMVFLSCCFAWLFYAPVFTYRGLWGKLFEKKLFPHLLMLGLFGTALPFTAMFFALQYTTPSNAAILNQVEILYSLILSFIFLKEKPALGQLGGSALVVLGVLFILANEKFSPRWTGDLIVICTPWMFQISHIFAKKLPKDLPPVFIAGARMFYAGLAMIPIVIFFALSGKLFFINAPQTYIFLFFMGTLYYGMTQPLWYMAIRGMDLGKATAVILSYPILTFVLSVLLGVESAHWYQVAGLALAFSGAYWISMIIRKEHKKNAKADII